MHIVEHTYVVSANTVGIVFSAFTVDNWLIIKKGGGGGYKDLLEI